MAGARTTSSMKKPPMRADHNPAQARKLRRPYRCFLVRCWLEEGAGAAGERAWRFTVQEARDGGYRRSFNCMKDVEAFLEAELRSTENRAGRG